MFEVHVNARSLAPFVELVGRERVERVQAVAAETRVLLGRNAVWNVNSTAAGGGVAEMLRSLLRYVRGLEVDVRWVVMEGPSGFFRVTKRLHNALHDNPGDGSPLGAAEAELYDAVTRENAIALDALVKPGDVVICHDPQTAGLVPHLAARGVRVVWRCHIGYDRCGYEVDLGWSFIRKYVEAAPVAVFSRQAYAPAWVPRKNTAVLPPNIDPFSAKNQPMDESVIRSILVDIGLVEDGQGGEEHGGHEGAAPLFVREDGTRGRVDRQAEVTRIGRAPSWDTPLVVQVSRWDRMKDPVGVLEGFMAFAARCSSAPLPALVLAGPSVSRGVADDPEGPEVFREVEERWREMPEALRSAAHLVQFPMEDVDENAAMVNALQRHAAVIVQKSLREGFGLTVTEAMWKQRPVVASAVGGIQDQIQDGVSGLLIHDPTNPEALADALARVLGHPELARRLGAAGYERVRDNYTSLSALEHWASLLQMMLEEPVRR